MHLRHPGTIDAAVNCLRQLLVRLEELQARSDRSPRNEYDLERPLYLDWVNTASSDLYDLFKNDSLVQSLHSSTYWEIFRNHYVSEQAWGLLKREIRVQADRLRAALELVTSLKEFASHSGHLVVLDTSALVQGVWFEDFDWPSKLGLPGNVRLVIPILVVEELDKLKDRSRTTRAGDRARRVARRLRELCAAVPPGHPAALPMRPTVSIEVLVDDEWHARRPNNDGEIIDQALLVRDLTGQEVRLVCVDAAMEFRARQHGLAVFAMPTPNDLQGSSNAVDAPS
jgi:hypothetical protein